MPPAKNKATSKAKSKKTTARRRKTRSSKLSLLKLSLRQWIGVSLAAAAIVTTGWLLIGKQVAGFTNSNKLHVTTSFYPLYFFTSEIAGDRATVINIIPAGADAHGYEPSPQAIADAYRSDVFIYHHGDMEPWAAKFAQDYKHTLVETSRNIDLQLIPDEHAHAHHDHTHDHDQHNHEHEQSLRRDPHIWTDPVLAMQMVESITQGLTQADPDNASFYHAQSASVKNQLSNLHEQFSQGLAHCQQRTVITSHAAFSYLADRYNLEITPIAGLTPEQEPSANKLAELSNLVTKQGITTIFFENQANSRLADTLARETGVKTSVLDPLESIRPEDLNQGANYFSIQRRNLENLRSALGCS